MKSTNENSLYSQPEYRSFIAQVDILAKRESAVGTQEYTSLAREAVRLKRQLPDLRADIAYEMVCLGSKLDQKNTTGVIGTIRDLFTELELPDEHIVTPEARERGDFGEVQQKWETIEGLLNDSN